MPPHQRDRRAPPHAHAGRARRPFLRLLGFAFAVLAALAGAGSGGAWGQAQGAALDPEPLRVGPLLVRLEIPQGPLLSRLQPARLRLQLWSDADSALAGSVSFFSTAAWQVRPGRQFAFALPQRGAGWEQGIELELLDATSPGPYECGLSLAANGELLGTLRTRFVKPVEWVVVGPFQPPTAGALLPPERGVDLSRTLQGQDGAVRWQRVPESAYDATGAVGLDALLHGQGKERCACALTILDLPDGKVLRWSGVGIARLSMDGTVVSPGQPLRAGPGRHTLIARSCSDGGDWRLGLTLLRADGTWPRDVDNDLERFLRGFDFLAPGPEQTTRRQVTLEVVASGAQEVQVLGTFNSWVPWRLEASGKGRWRRDLVLAPGRYAYKLRIDGRLRADAGAAASEADGFGGRNSILIVH